MFVELSALTNTKKSDQQFSSLGVKKTRLIIYDNIYVRSRLGSSIKGNKREKGQQFIKLG